jgi:acyl-CoA synthetase (AMP-forming)/AMP-acid ligase II
MTDRVHPAAGSSTLVDFLAEAVGRHHDRTAFVFGGEHWTYGQLGEQAHEFARGLVAAGVGKGAKVAVLTANRPEFAVAAFGATSAGCVVVPLSTLGTVADHLYVLRHSDAEVLVVQGNLRGRDYLADLQGACPAMSSLHGEPVLCEALPFLRTIVVLGVSSGVGVGWDDFVAHGSTVSDAVLDRLVAETSESDDAFIIYTSGSTARPKAVLHTHESTTVSMRRWGMHLGLAPTDRLSSSFPFFWTAGLAMILGGTLANGACLVMQEGYEPAEVLELVERERVTVIQNFDHTDTRLAAHPDAGVRDLRSIRLLRPGSPLWAVVGDEVEPWRIGGYGSSETFTLSTGLPSSDPMGMAPGSHGPAVAGMEVRIIEPDDGRAVPTGSAGEIAVRGLALMRGYYKTPRHACFDADGWFHTGDAGYLDDAGHLHWTGRLTRLVKTGGANVSPVEVEQAVVQLDVVTTAAAVGVPHPVLGEAVVVCAVPAGDERPAFETLLERLRPTLAPYKLPKAWLWVDLADVELTDTAKVRADALRRLAVIRLAGECIDPAWRAHLSALSV